MMKKQLKYHQYTWRQFKKNKPALVASFLLFFLVFIAFFGSFIANDQPIYIKYNGESFYPLFRTLNNESASDKVINSETGDTINFVFKEVDWRRVDLDRVVWPLIPYSPNQIDKFNRDYVGPSMEQRLLNSKGNLVKMPKRLKHKLGTDKLGRDVASGLIHGTKISLLVGLGSMLIAVIIGLTLGASAGYFGDYGIKLTRLQFLLGWLGMLLGYFYGFYVRFNILNDAFENNSFYGIIQVLISLAIWICTILFFSRIGRFLSFGKYFKKERSLPLDSYVNRLIEILNSLPIIILIISISSLVSGGSLWILTVIIGLTSWTGVARLIRAEMLRIKQLDYIQAGKVLGYSNLRIIFKHALPNGLAPVFVTFAFGVAAAILTESGLSFLGIGVPVDTITWGSLLSLGRAEFEAWWLVIYPGLAIFITITIFNLLGEGLRDSLDPKYRK